jgi:hypothetical protein
VWRFLRNGGEGPLFVRRVVCASLIATVLVPLICLGLLR